jgi:hypothetical protein
MRPALKEIAHENAQRSKPRSRLFAKVRRTTNAFSCGGSRAADLCVELLLDWPELFRREQGRGLQGPAELLVFLNSNLNVRFGSLADKPPKAKMQLCPLWSNSAHSRVRLSPKENPRDIPRGLLMRAHRERWPRYRYTPCSIE